MRILAFSDSIGLLTANYQKEGYKVIINGYIDEPAWTNIQKLITLTYKILLLPHLDMVNQRDAGRNEDVQMGQKAVSVHHAHFSTYNFFSDFIKLDTTDHSAEETVAKIMEIISSKEKH